MTKIEQQLEIAEILGWFDLEWHGNTLYGHLNNSRGMHTCNTIPVPNYPEDLNACHEMEKVLTEDQWGPYCVTLNKIACRIQCGNTATCGYTIAATAPQRCEAFIRTLGKWRD